MKNIALFFPRFDHVHLGKDVFIYPREISKKLKSNLTIFSDSADSCVDKSNYDFTQCKIANKKSNFILQALCVWKNAKRFDLFIFFHFRWYSIILSFLYKVRNPGGFAYIKGDMSTFEASRTLSILKRDSDSDGWFKKNILFMVYNYLSPFVDLLSVETTGAYNILFRSTQKISVKEIIFVPNGIDIDFEFKVQKKEKLIINVARIGTEQKNTEFLLKVLSDLELADWTFLFIGAVEANFNGVIDSFFLNNPSKIKSVKFIGEISSKNELNSIFAKSSIFCLSSRYESYGLVLSEAGYFNNFLLTTDVGAASDLINVFKLSGEIIEPDPDKYREVLLSKMNAFPLDVENDMSELFIDKIIAELLKHLTKP